MNRNVSVSSCEIVTHTSALHQLQQQRMDKEFCDVTLLVENKTFNAHRNVLAAVSEYFFKMFTIEMKEKYNQVIPLQTVTAKAINEILNSIYTGKMVLSEDSLAEILHAATMIQVNDVVTAATTYMRNDLSVSNYYFFKDLAILYSFENLLAYIDQFLQKNIVKISNQDRFLELPLDDIEELLKSDNLNVIVEENAFKIALAWVNKDLMIRQQYFPQLFKHVRLQFIPITRVVEIIAQNALVKSFSECRDMIEKTFSFHINPSVAATHKPRKCFASEPNVLLFFSIKKPMTEKTYKPESKQWRNLQFTSQDILHDCAVASDYSMTVFCGGMVSKKKTSSQVINFDGFRWKILPSLNVARCGAAAVFQASKLYVFGGETIPVTKDWMLDYPNVNHFSNSFECLTFECLNERWKHTDLVGQIPPRSYFSALAINDKIYLIGGYTPMIYRSSSVLQLKTVSKDVFSFLRGENTWKTCGQLNKARASFGCAVLGSSIYVVGGYSDGGSSIRSVEFKNRHDDTWTLCPTLIKMQGPMSACFVGNKMYVASKSSPDKVIALKLKKKDVQEEHDSELQNMFFIGNIVPHAEKLCQ